MHTHRLQAIFEHMCNPAQHKLLSSKANVWPASAERCLATSTLITFVVAAGKWAKHFPSFYVADVALARLPNATSAMQAKIATPSAVISNFAA